MDTNSQTLPQLFDQLGLPSDEASIKQFVIQHRLMPNVTLKNANFWTPAQHQFINESWHQDSDWCVVIDELNVLLHENVNG